MTKKRSLILVGILFLIGLVVLLYFLFRKDNTSNKEKFYLEDIYYQSGEYLSVTPGEVKEALANKKSFLLFTYNNFCNFEVPSDQVFQKTMTKYHIDVLKVPFEEFKETSFYNTIKLGPTLVIVKEGKIVDYLKADEDADIDKYQKEKTFEQWLGQYIYLEK